MATTSAQSGCMLQATSPLPAPLGIHVSKDDVAVLETALTRLIRRALLPTTGDATRAAAGVSLDRALYTALIRISEHAPIRLSALADLVGLDISTLSRHVARLEHDGFVARTPDPGDGRASLLTVTDAGRGVLERVRDTRRTHLQQRLASWDDDDVRHLAHLLDRLLAAFDDDRDRR